MTDEKAALKFLAHAMVALVTPVALVAPMPLVASVTLVAPLVFRPACAFAADKSGAATEYMQSVTTKLKRNWNPIRSTKTVELKVAFKVHKDGSVSDIRIVDKTNETANEQRAIAAVRKSAPFAVPPLALGEPIDIVINLTCSASLNLTVAQAIQRYGTDERALLRQQCTAARIAYPPKRIVLLALKDRQQLLMFAGDKWLALVGTFPLTSYSGTLGPKLRQGDLQIPEGIYRIVGSSARNMLSLSVDYPNAFDRTNALSDHRKDLGGDILIHGGSVSTGCIVVSNEQMQEIFVAAHDLGFQKVKLIIAPCDLTKKQPSLDWKKQPKWLPRLYEQLKRDLSRLPIPSG